MKSSLNAFALALAEKIDAQSIRSTKELNQQKLELSARFGISHMPANPNILSLVKNPSLRAKQLLGIKPVRTLSGVAPLAIMTKPIDCAHGTCIFCPGGEKSVFGSIPKSYTSP